HVFEENRRLIRETILSLPAVFGPSLYYRRTETGAQYHRYFHCARPPVSDVQIAAYPVGLLRDLNELAGEDVRQLGDFAISPDHHWLAYSLDRQGDETYCLYLKHLDSGNISELPLDDADGSLVWANDSVTLFAISMDEASRPSTLWRLQLGTPAVRVYHEADQRFYLHAYRSSSEQWLILASDSKNTSEVRVV